MGFRDSSSASTPALPTQIARDILKALVQDLKARPGDLVYEKPVYLAFKLHKLTAEEIEGGLKNAMEQGWLVFDTGQRIYTLTQAGFAIGEVPRPFAVQADLVKSGGE